MSGLVSHLSGLSAEDAVAAHYRADGYHELSTLAHRDEILQASDTVASAEAAAGLARMHAGLRTRLAATGATADVVNRAMPLLTLAPGGLKSDEPDTATLRQRLDDLAASVAALIEE